MFVSARVQFAVENDRAQRSAPAPRAAAPAPPAASRIPPTPDEVVDDAPDGAYLDGGEPVDRTMTPDERERAEVASMESYRARLRARAAEAGVRSNPGGVDTRYLDHPEPTQGVTLEQVAAIAEQVANAVLSRYAAERMPAQSPAGPPASGFSGGYLPAAPMPGVLQYGRAPSPFAPYYPVRR